MDRVKEILSIQNLTNVNHPNQNHQPPVNHYNSQIELYLQLQQLHHQQQQQHHHHLQLQQQLQTQQHHNLNINHHPQQQLQLHNNHNGRHSANKSHRRHQRNDHLNRTNNATSINNNGNDTNHSIVTNGHSNIHPPQKELIDLVTCKLCKGYLIDAATLDLCMHSFCRPCAVKYIREKPRCPECNMEIKDKRFLNRLKTDVTIQNIVYKLVPGLYEREMARRRKYYAARPSTTPRYKSEMFGDIPSSKTIKPDDMLNVCITWNRDCLDDSIKTHLYCRADSTMLVLKKLLVAKFGLGRPIKIYYGNSVIFFDLTTLMDVAATYNWAPENKILNLNFKEEEDERKEDQFNSLPLMSSVHDP